MPITKRGVYHNLKESKYTVSNQEVVLFFSSELYLYKFLREYETNRSLFRNKFNSFMHTKEMNFDLLSDIHLYKTIEKRGFRCRKSKGCELVWQELCQFALQKMTVSKETSWQRT